MLKARDHKGHDREKDGRDLTADGPGGIGHPNGDAHEEVAEDAAHERIAERQPRFRLCDGDNGRRELAAERGKGVPRHAQRRNEHRARKVAQIDNEPVAQHPPHRDRARQNAHDHEIVAGEELASGHDDHGELSSVLITLRSMTGSFGNSIYNIILPDKCLFLSQEAVA